MIIRLLNFKFKILRYSDGTAARGLARLGRLIKGDHGLYMQYAIRNICEPINCLDFTLVAIYTYLMAEQCSLIIALLVMHAAITFA